MKVFNSACIEGSDDKGSVACTVCFEMITNVIKTHFLYDSECE